MHFYTGQTSPADRTNPENNRAGELSQTLSQRAPLRDFGGNDHGKRQGPRGDTCRQGKMRDLVVQDGERRAYLCPWDANGFN